ncbi:MAG: hypothetical protein PUP92_14830 [Rhizonema sp. PD38]|nr:hypothetical protein [Rhizonema sp. PD38]
MQTQVERKELNILVINSNTRGLMLVKHIEPTPQLLARGVGLSWQWRCDVLFDAPTPNTVRLRNLFVKAGCFCAGVEEKQGGKEIILQ